MKRKNTDEFIRDAVSVHGTKYDYSLVEYAGNLSEVTIICPEHGEFRQTPKKHLIGHGCPSCARSGIRLTAEQFKEKVTAIHGSRYSYEKFVYVNGKTKGVVHCNECGNDFEVTPSNHLSKSNPTGCPICRMSHLEAEVMRFLERSCVAYIRQADKGDFAWLKTERGTFSLDFYLPKYRSAIECQGEQHFRSRKNGLFTEGVVEKIKERDYIKSKLCSENGIRLFYVNYDDEVDVRMASILEELKNGVD